MSEAIHKRNVRDALAPRREPYWAAPLEPGRFVGFRVTAKGRRSWIARARDDESGKQQYRALGAFTEQFDYPAATKAAREWFTSLDGGVNTKGPYTVEQACREYVEDRRREKGDHTADDAAWRFKRAVYGTSFGRTDLEKLRTPTVKKWRDSLTVKDDEDRKMGKAGANRVMSSVRAALNLAVRNRRVSAARAQEWDEVKQFQKADGRREIFLDLSQRRALVEAATGAIGDLIQGALLTGGRPGELVSAKRSAFDARTKTLKLAGKTGTRDVPLVGDSLALFERLAKSKLPDAPLFMRDDGQLWTKMEWSRAVRAAAAAAVVKDAKSHVVTDDDDKPVKLPAGVCLYSCRHTYISQAILDGLNLLDVARLTGTSLKMINEHYGHLVQAGVRERIAKVQML